MAEVTGLTKTRMLEIENASITAARKDADELILTTHGGVDINVGNVKGDQGVVGPSGVPVGSIQMYSTAVAPTGWLLCNGSTFVAATYPALAALIGTTFGGTTDNPAVPSMNGKVPIGIDATQTEFDAIGETGGEKTHTLSATEMPTHTHVQDAHNHTQNSHNHTQNSHNHTQNAHDHTIAHSHTINHDHSSVSSGAASWSGSTANNAAVYAGGVSGNRNVAYATGTAYAQTMYPNNIPHTHSVDIPTYSGSSGGSSAADSGGSTATNIAATATNIAVTATNIAATATNQNTGGGEAHNNIQPYIVLTYIIKAA